MRLRDIAAHMELCVSRIDCAKNLKVFKNLNFSEFYLGIRVEADLAIGKQLS